jgi:hypothetical protein
MYTLHKKATGSSLPGGTKGIFPQASERLVGNSSLTVSWKGCPSTGHHPDFRKTYLRRYGSIPSASRPPPRAGRLSMMDTPDARITRTIEKARFLKEGSELRFDSLSAARQDHPCP